MGIHLASNVAAAGFLAGHRRRAASGSAMQCSCGWIGPDWPVHRRHVLVGWLEERRLAVRARLLVEEGVEVP